MSAGPGIPPDVFRRGLRVLGVAIREQPRVFAVAVGSSGVYAGMTVASAFVFGAITQRVVLPAFEQGHTTAGALAAAAGVILGVAVLKSLGIVGRRLGAGVMQYRLQATYRQRVTRQYLRLPLAWHQRHPTGELLSNANSDVEAIWFPIAALPLACGVIVMLVVTAIALYVTDPVLALIGVAFVPAITLLNVAYSRRMSPRMARAQQLRGEVSEIAHESFDGALVVKTLGREAEETERFRARAEELRDALIAAGRVRGLFDPVMQVLPNLGVLVVLLVGASRVGSGALDVGGLVRAAYLFSLLTLPVRAIGWVLGDLPRSVVGWERVARVLGATGSLVHGEHEPNPDAGPAALSVQGLHFSYADGEAVLHDVDVDVQPGRTVALVGPTGSGKSTLVKLLVRLVDPRSGTVRLDEVDLRDLAAGAVGRVAAVVPQQTFVFADTVRGNVTLGLDVDDEDVWAALRLAQADGFVAALTRGLDTVVGERGATLSGGQRQRLAIARALVRTPRLLILDDATSSVDPRVEAAILRGLRESSMPSTVVVVAYRRATISLADEVVFMSAGRIRARGTHAELLAAEPGYARLVSAYDDIEQPRPDAATQTPVDADALT